MIKATTLVAFGLLIPSLVSANAFSVNIEGFIDDSFSKNKLLADFQECSLYQNGVKDPDAEIFHCEKGKQFTLHWRGTHGSTISTYVKNNNIAFLSQTRIGVVDLLQKGFNIGTLAVIDAR